MAKTKTLKYIYAVGKRRNSSARVRLFKGKGEDMVNGKVVSEYFPGAISAALWAKPFTICEVQGKYYVTVKVLGGGKQGQLDAVVQGIAKALATSDKDKFRASLKKAGLLTRDARIRQRRNVGMGGKSRRKKQSPKR